MQGSGVTNYATDAPSYAYTTATTEFDDELIRRNILTRQQVLYAKGVSERTIERLLVGNEQTHDTVTSSRDAAREQGESDGEERSQGKTEEDSTDEHDDDDDDDEIMQLYRQRRWEQVSASADTHHHRGMVRIDRSEWSRHVNEASHHGWVVVCLSSTPCRTGGMEAALQTLARDCSRNVKFVVIEAKHAFEQEWPSEYLPTLFLYRHGTMQKQLLSLKIDIGPDELETLLGENGVE